VQGIWAPQDWWESDATTIVIIWLSGTASRLTFKWSDPTSLFHSSCSINGLGYGRTAPHPALSPEGRGICWTAYRSMR
jgi:hypothetical protein